MAESQLSELRNARVLHQEARGLPGTSPSTAGRLEAKIGGASNEVERQIWEVRSAEGRGQDRVLKANDAPTRTW
jgi:hypothetical protein